MRAATAPRQGGFTLLEVLISLAILVSITALVYTALSGTLLMSETAQEDDEAINGARVAMARIQREVSMAFLDPRAYSSVVRSSQGGTMVQTYQTAFVAEDSKPVSKLTFSSFSHVRLYHDSREADLTEIAIFGDADEERQGLSVIMHREAPRIDAAPDEGGVEEVLARGVEELSLEYYDSRQAEWLKTWDYESPEQRNRLPKAVSITLKVVDSVGGVHAYRSKVYLEMWRALPPRLVGRKATTSRGGTQAQGGQSGIKGPQGLGAFGQPRPRRPRRRRARRPAC